MNLYRKQKLNGVSDMPPLLALIPSLIDTVKAYFPPDMTEEQKAQFAAKEIQLRNDMTTLMINTATQLEQEVTKRAEADMASDSWL